MRNYLGEPKAQDETKLGYNGGVGVAVSLGRVEGFVEGRVQRIHTDRELFYKKFFQAVPLMIGFQF